MVVVLKVNELESYNIAKNKFSKWPNNYHSAHGIIDIIPKNWQLYFYERYNNIHNGTRFAQTEWRVVSENCQNIIGEKKSNILCADVTLDYQTVTLIPRFLKINGNT